jgi:hypothetical protein
VGKSAQDIYAMALTILQVGLTTIWLPPNPDFNRLSPEEKDRIYQDLHWKIDSLNLWQIILCSQGIVVWRHWIRLGIRSRWPGVCNCFPLQIPGRPITRIQ